MRLCFSEVLAATGGALVGTPLVDEIRGVATDTRAIEPGSLFFALAGEKTDGHAFVADALKRGAAGAVVQRGFRLSPAPFRFPLVEVNDPRRALGDLAAFHRRRLTARVIGITGSNGKTTTREMIRHLLGSRVVASEKSFNNDLGVPLTIFRADERTEHLVLEMGTNAPGEIARLAEISRPDVAVITMIGESHLAGLGSREGVAAEKGALVAALRPGGVAVLNGDDDCCRAMRLPPGARARFFSRQPRGADGVWLSKLSRSRFGVGFSFKVNGAFTVTLPVPGEHNVFNALAAVVVALEMGVPPRRVQSALASFDLPPMRLTHRKIGDILLINDAYNSNPASLLAAAAELAALSRRSILVVGDMLELGAKSEELHRAAATPLAAHGFDFYVTVGTHSRALARELEALGQAANHFEDPADAAYHIAQELRAGDVVMLKGSRGMRLERIEEVLANIERLNAACRRSRRWRLTTSRRFLLKPA